MPRFECPTIPKTVSTPHSTSGHDVAHGPACTGWRGAGDFDGALDLANLEGRDGVRVASPLARREVEVVAVPGATDRSITHRALGQGSTLVWAKAIDGAPAAGSVRQCQGLAPRLDGVDAILGEGIRPPDRHPGDSVPGRFRVRTGNREGLVVLEPDVPVAAVTERLVARVPAAAQREMLAAGAFPERDVLEKNAATDPVRAIAGDLDLRLIEEPVVPHASLLPGQGARRTLTDDALHVVRRRSVGVDPGLDTHSPHLWQAGRAESGMRARATIVEDCDLPSCVAIEVVRHAVVAFGVIESHGGVGAIAERLRPGRAAATQGDRLPSANGLATRVAEALKVRDAKRPVLLYCDARRVVLTHGLLQVMSGSSPAPSTRAPRRARPSRPGRLPRFCPAGRRRSGARRGSRLQPSCRLPEH